MSDPALRELQRRALRTGDMVDWAALEAVACRAGRPELVAEVRARELFRLRFALTRVAFRKLQEQMASAAHGLHKPMLSASVTMHRLSVVIRNMPKDVAEALQAEERAARPKGVGE